MLKLRPHHIIDIVRDYGQNIQFTPHPYGHDYHTVAKTIVENCQQKVKLVISPDDICGLCIHLMINNTCDDILNNHPYSNSKQIYNDYLDLKIMEILNLKQNIIISIHDYLLFISKNTDIFDKIYPHSQDIIEKRKIAFINGLSKLGIN